MINLLRRYVRDYRRLLQAIVGSTIALPAMCLIVVLDSEHVVAQENTSSTQGITASGFIELVIRHNPSLEISTADVDAASAKVREAGVWQNPTIAYDREDLFEDDRGTPENYLRLELPLQISGRRSLLVDSAEQGVAATKADAKLDRVELLSSAIKAYLIAAAQREQVAILKLSHERLSKLSDSVRSRASEGDASGYDLTRIEIELTSLKSQIADANRDLNKSSLLLGLWAGSPGTRLDAIDDLAVGRLTVERKAPKNEEGTIAIEGAKARVSQHSIALDAAKRGWVPSLTLTGGVKTASDSGDTAWGYVAGVALTIPVFNFGQADKQKAKAALRRAEATLVATEHRTKTRLAVSLDNFNRSLQQAKSFEKEQMPRLAQFLHRAVVSYKEGERPVFELLEAHRTHREVHLRNIQLKLAAWLDHVELLEALGRAPEGNQ